MDPATDIQEILAQLGPGATREQILNVLMQDFTSGVTKMQDSSKTAYQEAIEAIQSYYDEASVGRGEDFRSNFNVLGEGLANLGENFAENTLGSAYAADQQYITEAADAALATDLAWFEKMQASQADLYNSMIIEMAAQMALSQVAPAAAASGGGGSSGGGGRSGGGGGSSSSDKPAFDPDTGVPLGTQDLQISANEDTKYYTPAFDQAVENLYSSGDPVNIQMADDINAWRNRVGTGGVVEIMQRLQEENDRLDNSRGRTPVGANTSEIPLSVLEKMQDSPYIDYADPWYSQEYKRAKAPGDADYNRNLLDWLTDFNPNHGPVVTLEQVNRDGKWNQNDARNQPMPGFGAQEDPGDWNENGVWETPRPFADFLRQNLIDTNRARFSAESNASQPTRYEDSQFSLWTGPDGKIMAGPLSDMDYSKGDRRTGDEYNRGPANDPSNPSNPFSPLANPGGTLRSAAANRIANNDLQTGPDNEDYWTMMGIPSPVQTQTQAQPSESAINTQEMFDNARRAQDELIQAQAQKRRWEEEQKKLQAAAQAAAQAATLDWGNKQQNMGRSDTSRQAPNAKPVTATKNNPHPMGTGTFGQTVRTGVPFYVAAPKPKPTNPRVTRPGTRNVRPV